ncbi:unnamed protein product, partial [Symbiodinium pilosum]
VPTFAPLRCRSAPTALNEPRPSRLLLASAIAIAGRLRRTARRAKWDSWSAGHGVELIQDDAIAKRTDHYSRPEGHCIVVSDGPIAVAERGSSRDYYAEVKIENDVDTWSSGLDMGLTRLPPDEIGKLNEQGLCWADFPDTWVLRGDGMLRINGRSYPPGVLPSRAASLTGWDTATLEMGDTCGLQVTSGGSELVGYRNGEEIGRLSLEDGIKVPLDADLYLVADIIGRAGEVEILDCKVPGPAISAPPPSAPIPPTQQASPPNAP